MDIVKAAAASAAVALVVVYAYDKGALKILGLDKAKV